MTQMVYIVVVADVSPPGPSLLVPDLGPVVSHAAVEGGQPASLLPTDVPAVATPLLWASARLVSLWCRKY